MRPPAGRPEPADRAQQRALAPAAARDQQARPRLHRHGQLAHQAPAAVGRVDVDRLEAQPLRLDGDDTRGGVGGRTELLREPVEPVNARRQPAQPLEVVDHHGHRREDRRESAARLHGGAHLELARQHARGDDRAGQHQGEEAERVLEQVQPELRADQPAEVAEHRVEPQPQPLRFIGLAARERDRLGVLADAHQPEAEVRLAPQLAEVEPHQRPGDRPQQRDEGRQLDDRTERDHREVQRLLREGRDVLGDALVRIVDARACV
jgi:hypothetical protein